MSEEKHMAAATDDGAPEKKARRKTVVEVEDPSKPLGMAESTPEPPDAFVPPETLEAEDTATAALLEKAATIRMPGNMDLEMIAAQMAELTGIPMKASNMVERLTKARAEGTLDVEKVSAFYGTLLSSTYGKEPVATPAAPAASLAPAPKAPPQMFFRGNARPNPPQVASPPAQQAPAPTTQDMLLQAVAELNRRRGRPRGLSLPEPGTERRIALDLKYEGVERFDEADMFLPGDGDVTVTGTVPEGVEFEIAELRRVQMHPYALDRFTVVFLAVDGVVVAPQGPATQYALPGGAPTATLTVRSKVTMRLRNRTTSRIPLAITMMIVPYESGSEGT